MGSHRVVESVATNLEGQRLGSFTRVSSAVRTAVESALHRILTPRRSIDVLHDIALAKARGKPYTIVFVGVNGVGKSTNLAKIAYWLLQNDVSVRRRSHPALPILWLMPAHAAIFENEVPSRPVYIQGGVCQHPAAKAPRMQAEGPQQSAAPARDRLV